MPDVPIKEIGRDQIFSAEPEWKETYDAFQPRPESIKKLKPLLGNDLRVDVYLGLWCPDSRNNVPRFIKIVDRLDVPVPIRYFSVQRKQGRNIRYYFEKANVERVPTFIFFRSDREIGRIVENPEKGLAEDMIAILSK
jgi:hypothetical protein